jgi:hypothetical protein
MILALRVEDNLHFHVGPPFYPLFEWTCKVIGPL